jgi:hypothetical protein
MKTMARILCAIGLEAANERASNRPVRALRLKAERIDAVVSRMGIRQENDGG